MKAGPILLAAAALFAGHPRVMSAQTAGAPGPAAIAVPHPLPPPASTLRVPPRDLYQQPDSFRRIQRRPFPGYYPAPVFGYGSTYAYPEIIDVQAQRPAHGGLRFESSPGSAQVYIDGAYVGVVEDFSVAPMDLAGGTHHVELRAAGYLPLHFDVEITPNQTTRYKGDLNALAAAAEPVRPAAALAPVPKKTTYIIPGCYAGDRPPTGALPRGCDRAKLVSR